MLSSPNTREACAGPISTRGATDLLDVFRNTGRADAMQKQVVAGDAEAAWEFGLQTRHASLQLIHLVAIAAEEVMVVLLAGNLIARRLAGKLNCNDPAFVSQILEVAIDGRDTEIPDASFRVRENLIRRERTTCFNEGSANRILLTGVTCRDF